MFRVWYLAFDVELPQGPSGLTLIQNPKARATRLVQPRCMVCVDYAWHIFADDPEHPDDEPHAFALFRMSEVTDTGRKFEPSMSSTSKSPSDTASASIAPSR